MSTDPIVSYDLYAVFGVDNTATIPEIKKVFRGIIKSYHSDKTKFSNESITDYIAFIAHAYNIITDNDYKPGANDYDKDGKFIRTIPASGISKATYDNIYINSFPKNTFTGELIPGGKSDLLPPPTRPVIPPPRRGSSTVPAQETSGKAKSKDDLKMMVENTNQVFTDDKRTIPSGYVIKKDELVNGDMFDRLKGALTSTPRLKYGKFWYQDKNTKKYVIKDGYYCDGRYLVQGKYVGIGTIASAKYFFPGIYYEGKKFDDNTQMFVEIRDPVLPPAQPPPVPSPVAKKPPPARTYYDQLFDDLFKSGDGIGLFDELVLEPGDASPEYYGIKPGTPMSLKNSEFTYLNGEMGVILNKNGDKYVCRIDGNIHEVHLDNIQQIVLKARTKIDNIETLVAIYDQDNEHFYAIGFDDKLSSIVTYKIKKDNVSLPYDTYVKYSTSEGYKGHGHILSINDIDKTYVVVESATTLNQQVRRNEVTI